MAKGCTPGAQNFGARKLLRLARDWSLLLLVRKTLAPWLQVWRRKPRREIAFVSAGLLGQAKLLSGSLLYILTGRPPYMFFHMCARSKLCGVT